MDKSARSLCFFFGWAFGLRAIDVCDLGESASFLVGDGTGSVADGEVGDGLLADGEVGDFGVFRFPRFPVMFAL